MDIGTPWNLIPRKGSIPGPNPGGAIQAYANTGISFQNTKSKYVNLDAFVILFQAILDSPEAVLGGPKIRRIIMAPEHLNLQFHKNHPNHALKSLRKVFQEMADASSSSKKNGGPGVVLDGNSAYLGNHFHLRFDYKGGGS